jgi:outer membrane receptor protein involved in Fe transport
MAGAFQVVALMAASAVPVAGPGDGAAEDSELIIVTGERTARTVRDTTSSVEVFDERRMEKSPGADRIEQILELVPNVQLSSGAEGVTIRGQDTTGPTRDLPAFLGGTRPRTTLVVDGRAVSFNEFIFGVAPLWDVDRVEVFRSPQTTTQGQNSIAGAIFVETNDPSASPELRARAIVGDWRTRQVSIMGSGPLSRDVAVRVAGDLRYSKTSSVIADKAVGADPNHDVYGLLRFKLLARPQAVPGMRLELGYTHSQSQMPQVEGVRPPFEKRRDPNATYGVFRTNVDSLTGRASVPLKTDLDWNTILTAGDSRIERFAPPGLGQTRIKGRDWSAETIFNWSPGSKFKATIGASYRHAKLHQEINLSQLSGIGRFADEQSALGLFGEANWSPASRLHLTAGLRLQRDSQRRSGELATSAAPIPLDYDRTFHAWLPKVSAAYDITSGIRAGILIQRAYNPGGTTLRFDTGEADNFDAEYLWDYEVFARASFANGRLGVSANLFRYDMKDAQRALPITIIAPTSSLVGFADLFNVDKARSQGAEVSIDWRPAANLTMRVAAGLLRTKILQADATYGAFVGNDFQRSPRFSGTMAIDWEPVRDFAFSVQARHNGGYFSDDLNAPERRVDGWSRIDARASYQFGPVELYGYVRNLLDDFHLTYVFNTTLATAGDPREFGIGIQTRL